MANTFFKSFAESDRTSSRTLLHEAIPITGSLLSGTYVPGANVKSFSHGMFKSVYDYPFLSSSANHLLDVTWGYSTGSCDPDGECQGGNAFVDDHAIVGSVTNQADKKKNMYNQMAQILSGFDTSGSIRLFDSDGDFPDGRKMQTAAFITFSRLLVKDEIKKGSFSITFGTHATYETAHNTTITLTDSGADLNHKVNSPAGEYGILYTSSVAPYGVKQGLIYYQAGVVVIPATFNSLGGQESTTEWVPDGSHRDDILKTGSMDQFADGLIHRIKIFLLTIQLS